MEYTKINCLLEPDTEINREILVAELGYIGYESFSETSESIEAYIPSADFSDYSLTALCESGFPWFKFSFTVEIIADQNWNEEWEKNYFRPTVIAGRCVIRAPFHSEYPEAEYNIMIDPGMAFGTGNHETTSLMISEILEQDMVGKTVLDIGCGTGILSILASIKGAEKVTAVDIDNRAVKSTINNAALNNVSDFEVIQGGAESLPDKKFDYIYANIQRNILLNDMPQYSNALKSGGELVLSGFYANDIEAIKVRASELGLHFKKYAENQKWVMVVFIQELFPSGRAL